MNTLTIAMRINIVCPSCSTGGVAKLTLQSMRNDNVYRGRCPDGHELVVVTQTLRHELLFEIGLNAIQDGYYREAVASFAASVERVYEFATRVIARRCVVPVNVFESTWKEVKGKSERQLGAFLFLYACQFSEAAPTLPNAMIKLRNDVIHKGELPEQPEAVEFGKQAYEVIRHIVERLRAQCLSEVEATLADHVAMAAVSLGDVYPRTCMVTPTALNIISPPACEFESFLSEL